MEPIRLRIKDVVDRIDAQLRELDRLTEEETPNQRRPPATPERIAEFEGAIGMSLPADYREFLLLHDGWEGFSGENALLSIEEMSSGPVFESVQELQQNLLAAGQAGPGHGLVFEASYVTRISYFDREAAKTSDRLDIVFWNRREIARYPSFLAYLQGYSETLDKLIAEEREKLR